MNKISLTIFLVLCFATSAFTQSPSISKGSTVVPKFTFKWSDFDSSWRLPLKLSLKIEQNSSGNLSLNGNENWKVSPLFPAYDGSSKGWDNVYRDEYPTPSISAYTVSKIERKKDLTEINLSKLNDRIVDLKLIVGSSVKDIDKALNEVLFVGGVEEFKKSDYYQNVLDKETSKLPKELSDLTKDIKISLLEDFNFRTDSIRTEIFKEKKYFLYSYADGVEYNTNRVNSAERTAITIQKYLPVIKKKIKLFYAAKEIDGFELKVKVAFRDFVNESQSSYENLQVYFPMDSLELFMDTEISDQELVDKSVVLLNDNRVKVNLSQFSN